MTANGWLQFLVYFVVLLVCMRPLGLYMARVFNGEYDFLRPVESFIYRISGVRRDEEMSWRGYAAAMLLFSFASLVLTYLIERLQHILPWNPQHLPGVGALLAWNTAASFTTNTNWQAYTPETTMSYFTQMAGLAYHNFFSAAVGIAVAIALVRGISRRESNTIGNFWVDTTRACLYVLLPICIVYALALVSQGVIQNSASLHRRSYTRAGARAANHRPGPRRFSGSHQDARHQRRRLFQRQQLSSFRKSDALQQFPGDVLHLRYTRRLTVTLGRMTGSPGHGWAVFAACRSFSLPGSPSLTGLSRIRNPLLHGVDQHVTSQQSGGNMEGKEVRFGIANSALFATITTDASCGAVNSGHDSFTPLGGMVPLLNIMLGEIIFGGVGSGLYGMLIFVVLAVFIAGLMVGRTPEYLGKKIEAYDVKMAMLYVLIFPLSSLLLPPFPSLYPNGLAGITNPGPHGLTPDSLRLHVGAGNNGSAFAGINANTLWYNIGPRLHHARGRFLM